MAVSLPSTAPDALPAEDLRALVAGAGLSTWALRLLLAQRGWTSQTRLMQISDPFFQIWFQRYDWCGVPGAEVCFHSGAALKSVPSLNTPSAVQAAVERAALRALDAHRITHALPRQSFEGDVVPDAHMTSYLQKQGLLSFAEGTHFPSENLPADLAPFLHNNGPDPLAQAVASAVEFGVDLDDDFSPYGRNRGKTNAKAHLDRDWGLDATFTVYRWEGHKVDGHRLRFSGQGLLDEQAAGALYGAGFDVLRGFKTRFPGALPPDFPPRKSPAPAPAKPTNEDTGV